MSFMRNRGYVLVCIGLVFVMSVGAMAQRIGEGRTLVVGIWGAEQEELVREHVVKPFEAETGAKVELVLGGSSDRFARLYAEYENPTMDVVYVGYGQAQQALKDRVVQGPNPMNVPEWKNLYPQAQAVGYGVAFLAVGIMYNTDLVTPAPTSWLDLWNPAYKGKVAPFVFPGTQGTAFLVMAARAHGGDEYNIDPGFEALKQLKPFPAVLSGIPETNLGFLEGDFWFAPQIHGYVYSYKAEGGPVDFVYPSEGTPFAMNVALIPTKAKNTDLAEIFINYHLAQANQLAYAQRLFYAPTNRLVELPPELAAMMPYGEDEVGELLELDWAYITAHQSEWAERWNREILE